MPNYTSQTSASSAEEIKQQTTSDSQIEEVKNYKFGEIQIKFTDISSIDENAISPETEKKFYKKVFKTKDQ